MLTYFETLLETTMNYLQNKYNISCNVLKTLLHDRVKHKSYQKSCICSTNSCWL